MFVDGENLAKRYFAMRGDERQREHVVFAKDIFVWSRYANRDRFPQVVRRHYYTSAPGDREALGAIENQLRVVGNRSAARVSSPKVRPIQAS